MYLKCKAICTAVNKKSSSPAFKDIKVGDMFVFSAKIGHVGRTRRGSHAVYISCINSRTGIESKLSFNQIGKVLDNFEFEECDIKEAIKALETLEKLRDLTEGTIEHFDRDDAMDVLYEVKRLIR